MFGSWMFLFDITPEQDHDRPPIREAAPIARMIAGGAFFLRIVRLLGQGARVSNPYIT